MSQKKKSANKVAIGLSIALILVFLLISFTEVYPPIRPIIRQEVIYTINASNIDQNNTSTAVGKALSEYMTSQLNASDNHDSLDITYGYYVQSDFSVEIYKNTPAHDPIFLNLVGFISLCSVLLVFVGYTINEASLFIKPYKITEKFDNLFHRPQPFKPNLLQSIDQPIIEKIKALIPLDELEMRSKAVKLKALTVTLGYITVVVFMIAITVAVVEYYVNLFGFSFSTYGALNWLFVISLVSTVISFFRFTSEDGKRYSDNYNNQRLRYFLEHGNFQNFEAINSYPKKD